MQLEMTAEAVLKQLGYIITEQSLAQMNRIIEHTKGFNDFSKHLLSLGDALAIHKATITMSNSVDSLKIKCHTASADNLFAFDSLVQKWSQKYKVTLQHEKEKNLYYIQGIL